ncbi:MAG: hypothetical protein U0271_28445 [Polyangiaceae bacterium]
MRDPKIQVFYRPEMAASGEVEKSGCQSPEKAPLLLAFLARHGLADMFEIRSDFEPFEREDLLVAHHENYVDAFLAGEPPLCESSRLPWTPELARAERFQNASLYYALRAACLSPSTVMLSPTAGFHHASPSQGSGYCAFSGQVIASIRVYRELGLKGAWLDLDGHFGNSIEDSRDFAPELELAVPRGCNLNPNGRHGKYLRQLEAGLASLEDRILSGELGYVYFAHGADSHEWDENGFQLSTDEWVTAAEIVYRWVAAVSTKLGRPLPLALALFGGYRADHYDSVLALHTADLAACLNILSGACIQFEPEVRRRPLLDAAT